MAASGEEVVRTRPGVAVRGRGMEAVVALESLFEFWRVCLFESLLFSRDKPIETGVAASDDTEPRRERGVAPGSPVRGFTTSDINDGDGRLSAVVMANFGEGSAKLLGVRGRDIGVWSRIWSIMCSRTARCRLEPESQWAARRLEGLHTPAHLAPDLTPSVASCWGRWVAWSRRRGVLCHVIQWWGVAITV